MKIHYKNLNPLRFIAAAVVVYSHIGQLLKFNELPNPYGWSVTAIGKIGVNLFYVLSGFLITSLMCAERDTYGRVAVKKFYIRRALRIWPLYYILVLSALFILPHIPALAITQWGNPLEHLWPNFLLLIFMLPNVQALLYGPVPYANQTWSIGVEEQYYLIWPLVFNAAGGEKRLKKIIIIAVAAYILCKILIIKAAYVYPASNSLRLLLYFFKNYFQIDCLLIGSYFGLLNRNLQTRALLTQKWVQLVAYATLAIFLISESTMGNFYWEVYAIVFGLIIINLVNITSVINIESKVLGYLGKISYSMYMWHFLMINVVIRFITHNTILVYILGFSATVLMSVLSYELVERKFFSIKTKYTLIKSG